jgi:hypothetical protein
MFVRPPPGLVGDVLKDDLTFVGMHDGKPISGGAPGRPVSVVVGLLARFP